ncbi:MAG: PaaX family transcriptional regulator [Myxococcota bacterium]
MVEPRPISPKSLVLDLLRVAPGAESVKGLCEVGALFGFTSNAVRVAVTRLVARGLVESDERGSYRLAAVANPRSDFVERWRLGDKRTRRWQGGWLSAWLPRGQPRAVRRRTLDALALLGFREGLAGVFVRPDNLAQSIEDTRADAAGLGIETGVELFVAGQFAAEVEQRFCASLWSAKALTRRCRSAQRELDESTERLDTMPVERAVVQTFIVGGQAIRVLATDPLLPDAVVDGAARRELTAAMLRYDARGRRVWKRFVEARQLQAAPVHLSLVHGGAA